MSNVSRIRAARHFDRLRAGDELSVDLSEEYWANQVKAGNVEVLDVQPDALDEDYSEHIADLEEDLDIELINPFDYSHSDPED